MDNHIIIGKIINTHGVSGEVKVLPLTDDINRFKKLKSILIDQNNELLNFNVLSARIQNDFVILKLKDINCMEQAQKLKECYIKINREDALKLKENTYFICDIIDIEVSTVEGEVLGKVKDVLQPGGNDVYVIDYNGRDLLIPAIKDVVKNIDVQNKKMTVKLLEGLKEL